MKTLKHPQTYINKWKSLPEEEYSLKDLIREAQEDAYQLALDTAIEIVRNKRKKEKTT